MIRADQIGSKERRIFTKRSECSGKDPPATLTNDGASINVAGMRWFPKEDIWYHST